MVPQVNTNTIISNFAYIACGDGLHVNTMNVNKWQKTVTTAFLEDDLTGHLFTLLWSLAVVWVNKIVDLAALG